jgi:RimJ/RimL family protein N-acetyltransferase
MAFWDWPHDAAPSETGAAVESMLRDVAAGDAHYWTVRMRTDRSFAGLCDLSELRQKRASADLGFMIARRLWGQGLAAEAVALVLAEARALQLTTIRARIHSANTRSARLLTRAGFVAIETVPACEVRPGTFRACTRFELALGPS